MTAYLKKQLLCLLFLGQASPDPDWFPAKLLGCSVLLAVQQVTWVTFGPGVREWLTAGPVFVVLCLWALDMVAGVSLALLRKQWSPTRMLFGCTKLLIWVGALAVAWLLRVDGYSLDDWFPPLVELAIILTEASSVLRNLAELLELATGKKSRVLRWFADRVDSTQEALLARVQAQGEVQTAQGQVQAAQCETQLAQGLTQAAQGQQLDEQEHNRP